MAKTKKQYVCSNCGSVSPKWAGQCFDCGEWSTIYEEVETNDSASVAVRTGTKLEPEILSGEGSSERSRIVTPIEELNRVLGGGLVPASAILVGGDPGIGKSTLLLQLTSQLADSGIKSKVKSKNFCTKQFCSFTSRQTSSAA